MELATKERVYDVSVFGHNQRYRNPNNKECEHKRMNRKDGNEKETIGVEEGEWSYRMYDRIG